MSRWYFARAWCRRTCKSVKAALPWLYLRGISTGQMQEALSVLLGEEAGGGSPALAAEETFRRLKGFPHLAKVLAGVRFVDGVEHSEDQLSRAAA